jgi:uncharacterized RDD family membrane protein YckC
LASSSSSSPEYVGFGERLIASVIDSLLVFVVAGPLVVAGVSGFFVESLLPALAVIFFWRYLGATPGKMAISAKIVDARTGGAPSTGRLVARYFAYIVSSLPLFLGFVWIAIDRRKQGWHDKIAGTVVVTDDD